MEQQYKILNAELMDQVQKQRIVIGEMVKAEVLLKKQFLEEREMRLTDAQHTEYKLKSAIRTLLQSLNLSLDVDKNPIVEISSQSEYGRQSRFSSNHVCTELRRSSALLRRSVTVSPTRRRRSQDLISSPRGIIESENYDHFTITKTPEPRRLVELQGHFSSPETPQEEPTTAETSQPASSTSESPDLSSPIASDRHLFIIEENDSEDTVLSIDLEDSKEVISISPSPLRELTNRNGTKIIAKKRSNPSQTVLISTDNDLGEQMLSRSRRAKQHSSPKQPIESLFNPKITITRGKSTRTPPCGSDNNIQEASIEHVRHAPRPSSPMPTSSLAGPLSPSRSHLNFSNFNDIADRPGDCSTPRHCQFHSKPGIKKSTKNNPITKMSTASDNISVPDQSSGETSLLSRPMRSCRPKSLKELSRRTKLRNETSSR